MFVCSQCFSSVHIWLLVENWFVSPTCRGVEVCLQAPAAMLGKTCYCMLTELPLLSELNLKPLCPRPFCFQSQYEYTWVALGAWSLPAHSRGNVGLHSASSFPKTSCTSGPWWPEAVCTLDLAIERPWFFFSSNKPIIFYYIAWSRLFRILSWADWRSCVELKVFKYSPSSLWI